MKLAAHRPSPATIIALIALFVALGGVGVAATGGNFILGQSNSAADTTGLSSNVASGATLALYNTGGRPAAKFSTNLGVPPFSVGNATKVPSLNADRLDGLDSTGFIQGRGRAESATLDLQPTPSPPEYALLVVPGLGVFSGKCFAGSPNAGELTWSNNTGHAVFGTFEGERVEGTTTKPSAGGGRFQNGGLVAFGIADDALGGNMLMHTWELSAAGGDQTIATVVTSLFFDAGDCVLRASVQSVG